MGSCASTPAHAMHVPIRLTVDPSQPVDARVLSTIRNTRALVAVVSRKPRALPQAMTDLKLQLTSDDKPLEGNTWYMKTGASSSG